MLSIHLIFTVLALTKVLYKAEVAHYIEPSTKEEDGWKQHFRSNFKEREGITPHYTQQRN